MPYPLKRYWFKFEGLPRFHALTLGCGVTAYDYSDALRLIADNIFRGEELPAIAEVIENVDVSKLDQGHVIPNMEPVVWRGVWFPKGYRLLE